MAYITDLMLRDEWVKDETAGELSALWGCERQLVDDDATEASRTAIYVARRLTDPKVVQARVSYYLESAARDVHDLDVDGRPDLLLKRAETQAKVGAAWTKVVPDLQETRVRHIIESHLSRSEEWLRLRGLLAEAAAQFESARDTELLMGAIQRFEEGTSATPAPMLEGHVVEPVETEADETESEGEET